MLAETGRLVDRWRYQIIGGWAAVVLAGLVFGGGVFDRTQPVDSLRPEAESTIAAQRLDALEPEGELVLAVISGRDFYAIDLVNSASRILHEIRGFPGVASVEDAYTSGANWVSDGNGSSLVKVELTPGLSDDEALAVADRVAVALRSIDAPEVLVGGELLAERTFGDQAVRDAAIGESVALVVLWAALIAILGGLVAGSLPVAAALATVAGTLLALSAVAGLVPVSEYAVNVVTLLGIGLAVDYSLLVLFRFREERAADRSAARAELLARTVATSGRAVLVSGLAVGSALVGLFVFAEPLLAAMALGGALVVCLATVAGLTLVPALIAVADRQIPAPGKRTWVWRRATRRRTGTLARLAAFGQRHAVRSAVGVTGGLLLLSVPLLGINLANSDARALPAASEERRTYEVIQRDFGADTVQPVTVLIAGGRSAPGLTPLLDAIRALPASDVDVRDDVPAGVTVVDLTPPGTDADAAAQQLVRDLRAIQTVVPVMVAGPAAELVDAKDATSQRLPAALLVIVVITGVLLFALTGSVVVPVKALCLNVLTLAATLGVLVAIFQWGWGAGVLGFQSWGALDITTPVLLFVFIFGLSMDYEVFLLARIKEEWDRLRGDDRAANDRAVLAGITATGPVITAAALAIGIVFVGFALGELVAVKEIGVGMAVAVLLDVTVVRGLLLPAVMSLVGRGNWWPHWVWPSARRARS